jgi:mannose-6-phosphate isomerase-like protein (cupin superfamily)
MALIVLGGSVGAGVLLHAESFARAGEEQQAAQAIERALQKHGADVHRCFEKVLADRLDAAGMVEVAVDVGSAGKVSAAKVVKIDKKAPVALAACIEKAALTWSIAGIEAGARVVLPFSFKPQSRQLVINGADVPERTLGASASAKGKVGPKRAAPFTVKVLADDTNVKTDGLSLTLLNVGPASRVAMHRHPHSAKILYLVKGHARLLGPEGVVPVKLDEGSAVFIPAAYPHVIENMGRQSTAVFLQAFSPPGPERVYRDPTDQIGRAEFEVIRDMATAKAPPEANGKVVVANAAEAKAVALPRDLGSVKYLIGPTVAAGGTMTLSLLDLDDGAELQGRGDATEVLYFVSGGGALKAGGETLPVTVESTAYLPRGVAYTFKVAAAEKGDKTVAVKFKLMPRAPQTGSTR